MGNDLDALKEAISPVIKQALLDIKTDATADFAIVESEIKNSFMDIVQDIQDGKSIEDIADKYDTKTKALVAAAFFKLSTQQTKTLEKVKTVLEQIGNIVLRMVLVKLTG